jgi:hypothetical protein
MNRFYTIHDPKGIQTVHVGFDDMHLLASTVAQRENNFILVTWINSKGEKTHIWVGYGPRPNR